MVFMNDAALISRLQQGRYGDSAAEILATCKAAAAINEGLGSPGARAEWLNVLGLHPDTWAKLLSIARAEPLHDPAICPLLPPSFSTLALLSRCSHPEFTEAIKEGLIAPELSHRTLAAWRKAREERQTEKKPILRLIPMLVAVSPETDPLEEMTIEMAVRESIEKSPCKTELIRLGGWDNLQEQATKQWQEARLEEARIQINRLIAPLQLSPTDLWKPLAEIKDQCAELNHDQWIAVYTLKNAHTAVYGPTKQQRYAARNRLQMSANNGNSFARELTWALLGTSCATDTTQQETGEGLTGT